MSEDFFEKVGTAATPRTVIAGHAASGTIVHQPAPASLPSMGGEPVDRRWAANDSMFWASAQTHDQLPPGLYRCGMAENIGAYLTRTRCDTDDLIELPDAASGEVLDEIRTFWTLEKHFRAHGFLHKRGVMLYGPPGSGKTATINQLIELVIKTHGGIGIFIDHPQVAAGCLQLLRKIEPNRPVVALLEDLDALVHRFGENEYLSLLDGEAQIDNIVFVATTNYPEQLDRRFVDRPSRFDLVKYIGMPTPAARRAYLLAKEPSLARGDIDAWVRESDGFSIAHLREMIILCFCYQKPLAEAVARLKKMQARKPTSDDFEHPGGAAVGFLAQAQGAHRVQ